MAVRLFFAIFFAAQAAAFAQVEDQPIPDVYERLFRQLDKLGRDKVKDARFVEVTFGQHSETAWLVEEDDLTAVLMREDLVPWTFSKEKVTRIPSSWHPAEVVLTAIKPADFEEFCRKLASREENDEPRMRLRGPFASHRVIAAHAAWKKGLTQYCVPILESEPGYRNNKTAFAQEAMECLAWLHYLRGVNLLMYADRQQVLPHLRLVQRIAPDSEHAKAAAELLPHLERMITSESRRPSSRPAAEDIGKLPPDGRARAYIEQLRDLHCVQSSQPGAIMPYATPKGRELSKDTPSAKLKDMGYDAVPQLIAALKDDTPTRTIYHWRDFAHSRLVWRVSDFAWHILRDISGREFGQQSAVGFTFSSMSPEEQLEVRQDVRQWYEETKDLSPDDRMMTYFQSESFDDWINAAKYFAAKNDPRPVPLLLDKLKQLDSFQKGELCEVIATFGDASAAAPIRQVLKTADEASDRISASIALWRLGDNSGIKIAIDYVTAENQPYGSWDTPVWFLMRCESDDGIDALRKVVKNGKPERAGSVVGFITAALTGDLHGQKREPAGSVKVADVIAAGMERDDPTSMMINNVQVRIKDQAALAFVVLRDGAADSFGGRFVEVNPSVFDMVEPDASKRDAQIKALLEWYRENRSSLSWNEEKNCLKVNKKPSKL